MTLNAGYRARALRGILFYKSYDDMARERGRWTVDAIVTKHSERGEHTRPATWEDLKRLARLLNKAGVECARGRWVRDRGTRIQPVQFSEDTYILVNPEAENSRR